MKSEPIEAPNCDLIAKAKKGEEYFAIKIAVICLMNYFEDIAVLYSANMVDRNIIDRTLRRPVMRYYEKIIPLAKCFDDVAGYPSWKPLDDLIAKWKSEDEAASAITPKRF